MCNSKEEDVILQLIQEYDCPYGLGGDSCVLSAEFKCDIIHLNKECPHYINEKNK